MPVIERVRELPPLPPGVVVPDTAGDLLAAAGLERIYAAVVGEDGDVHGKQLSPFLRMPDRDEARFVFTVTFPGPLGPLAYATLMEGDRQALEWRWHFSIGHLMPRDSLTLTLRS